MSTMEDLDPSILYCLFKGEPGTRKSTCALSFPTPQYWFDVDQKMESLATPMLNWGIKPSEIHFDPYVDFNKIRAKLEKLQENCPYKTIVLDSVTSIGDATNSQTIKFKSGTTNKQGEEKGARIGGIEVGTWDDYKAENSAFRQIMGLTKDISKFYKVNVILIGHVIGERKKEDQGTTAHARTLITGGKAISGKISAYTPEVYHFNVIANLDDSKEDSYEIVTQHSGDDFARTTLPIPRRIDFGSEKKLYDTFLKPAIDKRIKELKENSDVA